MAAQQQKVTPRILFVSRCFPPTTGGMERFAKDLRDALETQTQLTSLTWGGSKLALPIVMPYFFLRAFFILAMRPVDIIHAQDGVMSILLTPLARLFRRPLVVVIHGLDVTYKVKLYQKLIRWSLTRAATIVCISSAAKKEVMSRGVPSENIHVVPLGVTDDIFYDDPKKARHHVANLLPNLGDQKILLANGRLVERKGLVWFVAKVMPALVREYPKVHLVISGDGPTRPAIDAEVARQQLRPHVSLLGRTSDADLNNLYNAADCFVMPNVPVPGDMEGFGRVLVEAALCEVPVVASNIEGIAEAIIDGKNGTLVAAEKAEEHIQAILSILKDSSRSRQRGHEARAYSLAHYDWSVVTAEYQHLYQKVLEGKA